MHVALVTREVIPLVEGGGIARYVAEAAAALAAEEGVQVTILTSSRFAGEHARLVAAGDPRATLPGVRWAWVREPEGDLTPLWSHHHAWSLACWEAVRELAEAGGGVDVVEFDDYGGAAAATVDARRTGHPALARALVAVRLHTTWEMTQVLDGLDLDEVAARTVMALERHALAFADRVLAPGERTLAAYRERYERLGEVARAPMPVTARPGEERSEPPEGPLRILFVGRLQRLKGVEELVRAVLGQEAPVELTLAGGDTDSAPGGGSMRRHLEALAGGDPRIAFAGQVPHDELPRLVRAHDLVAAPSHFEAFSYVVREALAENRPVLGGDAGGVADALEAAGAGWLVPPGDAAALETAVAALAADPAGVRALIAAGSPRAALERELDAARFTAPYRDLHAAAGEAPRAPELPALAAVVTVQPGERDLERTLDSLEAAAEPVEVIVAAAGPELVPARALGRLHAVAVAQDGALADLRREGLARATAPGPRLLLRAGDTVSPAFLEHARRALARNGELAYVTAFAPGRRPSCVPIGNFGARLLPELRIDGAIVLAQREDAGAIAADGAAAPLLDLAEAGRFGAVLPERLVALGRPPAPALSGPARAPSG